MHRHAFSAQFAVCTLALSLVATTAFAQQRPGGARRGDAQEIPQTIPGYSIQNIQGFTVIINQNVLEQDVAKFQRKPLEVLDYELSTIVGLMPPKATDVLRRLLIWVEWDEKLELANGRKGDAAAVYYGGHQLQLLKDGKHPLKAKSVTVLSMLSLTREHQPDRDSGRCVLLHEMAHAVHNELLGRDAAPIKAAYAQAMQRNLYDKQMYAATNEQEFFAELTCAYFDQLHYYPRTRADLEKHDPVSFQIMQEVWGKRQIAKPPAGAMANRSATSSATEPSSAEPAIELSSLDLGTSVCGPTYTPADLEKRPVVVLLWNGGNNSSLAALSKLQGCDDALGGFGLLTIAQHLTGQQQIDIEEPVKQRGVRFAITEGRWTNRSLVRNFTDFPLCLVFDHRGKCVYQGSPFDAESAIEQAVGAALVAPLEDVDLQKPLAAVVESLRAGQSPQSQLLKLAALARSKSSPDGPHAAELLKRLTSEGQKQLDAARDAMQAEPVASFVQLERIAAAYKGAPLSQEATKLMGKLRALKPVQQEFQARQGLNLIKRFDTELAGRPGSFDPTQDKFRTQNAALLSQLQKAIAEMKQTWPDAHATAEATAIGAKYGLGG